MTITAKFSNGHTDTYKGNRDVKAAWMITDRATGEVLASGHSLDAIKARKTAEGNVQYCHAAEGVGSALPLPTRTNSLSWVSEAAREAGWNGKGSLSAWVRNENARRKAARDASVKIEVVAL